MTLKTMKKLDSAFKSITGGGNINLNVINSCNRANNCLFFLKKKKKKIDEMK